MEQLGFFLQNSNATTRCEWKGKQKILPSNCSFRSCLFRYNFPIFVSSYLTVSIFIINAVQAVPWLSRAKDQSLPNKIAILRKDSVFIDGILKQFGLSKTGFKSTCCEAYQMVSNSFCQENIQISISECDNSVTPYLL